MSPSVAPPTPGEEGDPLLLEVLRRRISEQGPLPFSDFMRIALYHPGHGYYARTEDPVGRHEGSDYYTAPSRHHAFGSLLGRQVAECLDRMGAGPAEIVEVGPGSGDLLVSVLRELRESRGGWPGNLQATLVEGNPGRAGGQRRLLEDSGFNEGVRWVSPRDWEDSPDRFRGIVLANEVLDAMPIHRVVFREGGYREILVDWKDGLLEVQGPVSDALILHELERSAFTPREGQEVEVGLEALHWIRRLGSRLAHGYAILADYGYPAREIYSPRHHRGTLLAYHRHRTSEEYLARVGFQDLTAHVNFTSLMDAARSVGLQVAGPVGQGRFLVALGVLDRLGKPGDRFSWDEYRDRKALQDLFLPGGLGESHQILVLGTPGLEMDLIGVRPPERWSAPAEAAEGAGPTKGEGGHGTGST